MSSNFLILFRFLNHILNKIISKIQKFMMGSYHINLLIILYAIFKDQTLIILILFKFQSFKFYELYIMFKRW